MSPRSIRRAAERRARKEQNRERKRAALSPAGVEQALSPACVEQALSPAETAPQPPPAKPGHSTGPRTEDGKKTSSRNAFKHGLASGELIIAGESCEDFDRLLSDLFSEHQPASETEALLVHEMAQSFWLSQRALRLQNNCFSDGDVDTHKLGLFLRYQTTHERAFHKALATLLKLKQNRAREQAVSAPEFVSQNRAREQAVPTPEFVSQNRAREQAVPTPEFVSQNLEESAPGRTLSTSEAA